MENIIYLVRETFAITQRNLLKLNMTHLLNTLQGPFLQILAAANIPGIVVLFYSSSLLYPW